MAKPTKPTPKSDLPSAQLKTTEVLYAVEKVKQIDYKLIKITIQDDVVVSREVIARDIPPIIQGKYMMELNKQGFTE